MIEVDFELVALDCGDGVVAELCVKDALALATSPLGRDAEG